MTEPAITVEGLSHAFGAGEAHTPVMFDLSLTVPRGELLVLRGASGSGKTTLLTLMACLREVQSGRVRVLEHELRGASEKVRMLVRRRLGFIFQAHNLHESLTALQNVRMGIELHGPAAMSHWQAAARHVLTLLGLGDRLDHLPAKLSGGQKQRVAVARALVGNPDIVFADEPTAALDAESGRTVVQLLKDLGRARGTTTVMVTHDAKVMAMADRVLTLERGRLAR